MHKSDNVAGALVIIGGSEDHRGERRILAEFVRFAGGADALGDISEDEETRPVDYQRIA